MRVLFREGIGLGPWVSWVGVSQGVHVRETVRFLLCVSRVHGNEILRMLVITATTTCIQKCTASSSLSAPVTIIILYYFIPHIYHVYGLYACLCASLFACVCWVIDKKAVLMHRTPREAKAVYPSDWMRKLY